MDVHASLDAACGPAALFGFVDDLARYPSWIDLVHRAEPVADSAGRPAWDVELRARIGPFARSKRLRMVRTQYAPDDGLVVFDRDEIDGRRHAPWMLRAQVSGDGPPAAARSELTMHLHYGGGLWTGGLLERALTDQIERGRSRLAALAAASEES